MNRKRVGLIIIIIIIVIVCLIVLLTMNGLDETKDITARISELESEGYNVQYSPYSFAEDKAERPLVLFTQTSVWNIFKQQVEAAKQNIGFVTVWVCENDKVLWVGAAETQYYYYHCD